MARKVVYSAVGAKFVLEDVSANEWSLRYWAADQAENTASTWALLVDADDLRALAIAVAENAGPAAAAADDEAGIVGKRVRWGGIGTGIGKGVVLEVSRNLRRLLVQRDDGVLAIVNVQSASGSVRVVGDDA